MLARFIFLIISAITANAVRTYNLTQANLPGEFNKYHCLTTDQWLTRIPACVRGPQKIANKNDGCAYDDFVCHCINYQVFSDIIEPLVFPPALGGSGTCTIAELNAVRPVITDMCNYFNATLYTPYAGCLVTLTLSWPLSVVKTLNIVNHEPVKVTL